MKSMAARKGKKAPSARKVTTKRKNVKSRGRSADVFSDDEKEVVQQERVMDARADVDVVFDYEEPTFDQEDSEVDEDEAFNSDDETAYGMIFNKQKVKELKADDEDGGDLLSDLLGTTAASRLSTASDDDETQDQKIPNLQKMVDALVNEKSRTKVHEIDAQYVNESTEGELTLGTLLGTQPLNSEEEDVRKEGDDKATISEFEFRRVRQQVRELEGDGQTLTLQTNRDVAHDARAQRKLAYIEKRKEVDVFEPVVRRNRKKVTQDFRIQAPKLENVTPATLTSKFVAQTDMEKSVAALLKAGDLSDKRVAQDEEDELARKHSTLDEVALRQKELSKLRSLLFYEEQKQKRVKKIKSKLYHKIRNAHEKKVMAKQTDELRALDPDLARRLDDELAEKRAEERLTLKHRNTSKWVKHQLGRGIQAEEGTREAIADQLRRGEELRRKIATVDSDEEEEEEEEDAASHLQKRLEKQATALVMEIDKDTNDAKEKRGLQGMKFMQRAAAKQRAKARREAEKLLHEIRSSEGDGNHVDPSEKELTDAKKSVGTQADEAAVTRGALQTTSMSLRSGLSARASGVIAIDLGDGGTGFALATDTSRQSKELELGTKESEALMDDTTPVKTEDVAMELAGVDEANPWLLNTAKKSTRRKKSRKNAKKRLPETDVGAAIESLSREVQEETDAKVTKRKREESHKTVKNAEATKKQKQEAKVAGQDELVRRAFEFVAEDDDELAHEKNRLAEQEVDVKKGAEIAKLVGMSGWGSWAGDGVRVSKRQLLREQTATKIAKDAKQTALANRKDARLERVLINEKKDKKAARFTVKDVPYPFTCRQEYEAAMRNPLGSDWNTSVVTNVLTAPKVMTRAGTTIIPLVLSKDDRKMAIKELSLKRKAKF
ncbi:hypothetical protein CCR75_008172 [Bremia lactucae]|uniref:U3 small nucleolar RNA-associated protein 14 n=1 Tax=Bremia lactucae TaxID=4779 RepID=A0A976IF47_BRELC|nr:hypothetical protein CCR75_008172 [Bremia lactucae]